ncbi:hypothetical protein T09_433, partial [Trichinella sp. T9]
LLSLPRLHLGYGSGRCPIRGLRRRRWDLSTNPRYYKRLHPRAGTSTAGALGRSKPKFHSAPSALWPHTTSQCREAATLMGPSESEDIRHILTDEGDC